MAGTRALYCFNLRSLELPKIFDAIEPKPSISNVLPPAWVAGKQSKAPVARLRLVINWSFGSNWGIGHRTAAVSLAMSFRSVKAAVALFQ
jgi:hypothetical protein